VGHLQEALRLDPRSISILGRASRVFAFLRRYELADSLTRQLIALVPDDPGNYQRRVKIRLAAGDLAGARQLMDAASPAVPRPAMLSYMTSYYDLYWVLLPPAQDSVLRMSVADFDGDLGTYALVKAEIYAAQGDTRRSMTYADSARQGFEAQVAVAPNDPQAHVLLAMALSLTSQTGKAVQEAEKAVAITPLGTDLLNNTYDSELAARVYVRNNQPDKAIDVLEKLLKLPGDLTPARLRIDPYFAALKGNPRFEKLIAAK
jgi:tetratricopeptide (TPR) repeat protein